MSKLTEARQTIANMEAKIAELVAASQASMELVSIVTAERDALADQVAVLRHAALELHGVISEFSALPSKCLERAMFDTADRYFQRIKSATKHHPVEHDEEVAKAAFIAGAEEAMEEYNAPMPFNANRRAEQYASKLGAKVKP